RRCNRRQLAADDAVQLAGDLRYTRHGATQAVDWSWTKVVVASVVQAFRPAPADLKVRTTCVNEPIRARWPRTTDRCLRRAAIRVGWCDHRNGRCDTAPAASRVRL